MKDEKEIKVGSFVRAGGEQSWCASELYGVVCEVILLNGVAIEYFVRHQDGSKWCWRKSEIELIA